MDIFSYKKSLKQICDLILENRSKLHITGF